MLCYLFMLFPLAGHADSLDADFSVIDINEGELHFLTRPPKKAPHHHSTHITINNDSLTTGWVGNKQCHYNLGQVPALEIVFRKGGVRGLDIVRAEHIGKAWVENDSVQLEDLEKNAIICIVSETRSLRYNDLTKNYEWRGGPYMRRFLDGYFPMKVSLAIDYPSDKLRLETLAPAALLLKATALPGHLRLSTLFEGRLNILVLFTTDQPASSNSSSWFQ